MSNPYNPNVVGYQGTGGDGLTPQDVEHLNLLKIFWYIMAGLQVLGLLGGCCYAALGIPMANMAGGGRGGGAGEPAMVAATFMGIGGCLALFSCVFAYLNYLVAKGLQERRRLTLIYVMAGLACLSFPLGTALGVFTFIVVARPQVKAAFR